MHWIVLAVSCVAILAGIDMAQVWSVIIGLVGMIIGLLMGARYRSRARPGGRN
jgi:hypothetical protein